ncbi:MAG: carbamate kinase, partial [Gemmatimonadetes bacterium]|nr:carbamate kinase [Gemmatimonadota bacterium]
GGGIPVIPSEVNGYDGVEAVVDKDLTASLLARRLAADLLVICTAVPHVSVDFGKPTERPLRRVTAQEIRDYDAEGQFSEGSMAPKVRACADFVTGGGVGTRRRAIITDMHTLHDALAGQAGTVIVP